MGGLQAAAMVSAQILSSVRIVYQVHQPKHPQRHTVRLRVAHVHSAHTRTHHGTLRNLTPRVRGVLMHTIR